MANLVIPTKNKHEYVVGIDFGHGETSAAICELEWDKTAGQRLNDVQDIDVDRAARKKVISSAICRANGGLHIGDYAFEHMTDNDGIRVCFKQKPENIDGEAEMLMMDYMKAVYHKILEYDDRLQEGNHLVYIARPSGWTDETAKELYREMAIKAGIPLAGLTSESRAAIFYAKSPRVNFANEINKGAIVFDLGSSTLDFTYLSDNDKPIDYGYDLGASKIDKAIYKRMILTAPGIQEFISEYPEYNDALLFKARQFKEKAYSRNESCKTIEGFQLGSILSENDGAFDEYAGIFVPLQIRNLQELNDLVEDETSYQQCLKDALEDFKVNHLHGKRVNGVFLTGGASRMNFIRPLIAEIMGLSEDKVKIDGDNPSLTISRGIALLGATDATTLHLTKELKATIPSILNNDILVKELIGKLADDVSRSAWKQVEATCKRWVKKGTSTKEDQLKEWLKKDLHNFKSNKIRGIIQSTLQNFFVAQSDIIGKKLNEIISQYAPGREISMEGNMGVGDINSISKSLDSMSDTISKICDSITNTLSNVLWAALGIFLFGIFSVAYYLVRGAINLLFRNDSDIRQDKVAKILEKKSEVINEVREKLSTELSKNSQFRNALKHELSNYFGNLIDLNLEKVIIPIE